MHIRYTFFCIYHLYYVHILHVFCADTISFWFILSLCFQQILNYVIAKFCSFAGFSVGLIFKEKCLPLFISSTNFFHLLIKWLSVYDLYYDSANSPVCNIHTYSLPSAEIMYFISFWQPNTISFHLSPQSQGDILLHRYCFKSNTVFNSDRIAFHVTSISKFITLRSY